MADNVPVTAGSGTSIATDDVGGVHYPKMKLFDGTDGSSDAIPGNATTGLQVKGGNVNRLSVTPTISTGIYASGDAIGGLLTFTNAARVSGGGLTLRQVVVVDKDQEMAPLDLVLFDRTFTNSSDNAVFDPTDADLANVVAVIPIATYANFNDNAVGYSAVVDIPIKLNGTSLFGQMVVRSTPTYTATSDLIVLLNIVQE